MTQTLSEYARIFHEVSELKRNEMRLMEAERDGEECWERLQWDFPPSSSSPVFCGARWSRKCSLPAQDSVEVSADAPVLTPDTHEWNNRGGRSPVDMYQGVTMTTNHGPASYEPGFLHNAASAAASAVYVTPTRVTPMIPALPYLQTPQQSSPVSGHSGWTQPGADAVASYNSTGGHHHSPVSRFTFSTSPPLSSGVATARETATYTSPLNISTGGREHYGSRGLSGSYHSGYPAYVSPNIGGSWAASHFDSSVLHSLQTGGPAGAARHPNLGEKYV